MYSNSDRSSPISWRKSSYSGQQGECVELASVPSSKVAVRDSVDPTGPVLTFSKRQLGLFFMEVKKGSIAPP
ncbi:DUF397 domain-containing protein [Spirillospora sp. NPDC029432]|uniref:DUF397 domain-containing protein n=1 Tax=Spirillospora sp. NPDC029432 TaxID=3154599 RepID=UPI0034514B5F